MGTLEGHQSVSKQRDNGYHIDCIVECSSVQRHCDHVQYLYFWSPFPLLPLLLLSLLQLLVLLLNQGDECVAASLELLEPMEQSYKLYVMPLIVTHEMNSGRGT